MGPKLVLPPGAKEMGPRLSHSERMEHIASSLPIEAQTMQSHETIAKVSEYVQKLLEIKKGIWNIWQEAQSLPTDIDEIFESDVGETFSKLRNENSKLVEELEISKRKIESLEEGANIKNNEIERAKLATELGECQTKIESLEKSINIKNNEIESATAYAQALEANNVKLQQKVEKIQQQFYKERVSLNHSHVDGFPSPSSLETAAKDVFSNITTFTNLYAKFKSSARGLPAKSFVESYLSTKNIANVHVTRDHHWIMLLKSAICCHLFHNFETETFIPLQHHRNTALFLNHEDRVRTCITYFKESSSDSQGSTRREDMDKIDSLWSEYLTASVSAILPSGFPWLRQFEKTNFWLLRPHLQPNEQDLFRRFIMTARKVWNFHKLCLSFEPPVTIYRVAAGDPYNGEYMSSPVALEDDDKFAPKVGFMIYPGFRLRKTVIKCEVYFGV